MKNKTISFETAEAAVMQTWKSLLKQTNPYLVPILLPMIEHFKPLFQEFYDLGVSHGRTAQVPEGFVLVPKEPTPKMIDATWNYDDAIRDMSHNTRNEFIYKATIEAQEQTND